MIRFTPPVNLSSAEDYQHDYGHKILARLNSAILTSSINRSSDTSGAVSGIFVEGSDVTDHVRAEEKQQLLIRELHHRVKNTLATVQAILGSTARASLNITDFHEAFAGRLVSLGKTHSILTDSERQEANVI